MSAARVPKKSRNGVPNAAKQWLNVAQGMPWAPTKVGQEFVGKLIDKRSVETKHGWKWVCDLCDENTGETISQWAGNLATSKLAQVPNGTLVKLVFTGKETVKIGRKMVEVLNVTAMVPPDTRFEPYLSPEPQTKTPARTKRGKKR